MTSSKDDQNDITRSHLQLVKDTVIGHYRIIEKIGAGGMGEVYLAEDTELNRKVALKFLLPDLCRDPDCRARFKREAQAAAKLNHPNIITIFEVSEFKGRPFFAMENIEGESLTDFIKTRDNSIEKIIDLSIQICDGLNKAHQAGIIHRDIKPSNILIDHDSRAKILDFGLATIKGTDKLTKTGSTLGTLSYMSPEQTRGEEVDQRSDIFSFGAVLYEMITGQLPFKGDHEPAIIYSIAYEEPEPLARYKTGVPDELQRIIGKVLSKEKGLRYQHSDELRADLRILLAELGSRRPGKGLPAQERRVSIAVLPFMNMSPDKDNEYFSDGMTEDIIARLAKIRNLRVISRTSIMRYKHTEKDVREIGQELNVTTILEGSVRKTADRVRIVCQLIDAETDGHMWAETYDRQLKDIFEIQSDVAQCIADALRVAVFPSEQERFRQVPVSNLEAYNSYLRGRFHWNKRTGPDLQKAIEYFDLAIEKESTYALAYAGLASTYVILPQLVALPSKEIVLKAEAAANIALQLDPTLAEAHAVLGCIKSDYEWDWPGAESVFKRSIELDPNYPTAHHWYSMLLFYLGRLDEALAEIKRAQKLDPLSLIINTAAGSLLCDMRQYDKAIDQLKKVLELDPGFWLAHYFLGQVYEAQDKCDEAIVEYLEARKLLGHRFLVLSDLGHVYGRTGRRDNATKILNGLLKSSKQGDPVSVEISQVYLGLGDKDKAFEWLERAYQERSWGLLYLKTQPLWDDLRSDPRFTELLKKMKLEP